MDELKLEALARFLDCDPEEAEGFLEDYRVYTDDEADQACGEYIRESAWAFNSWFIASHARDGFTEEIIDSIKGDRCEDVNDAILAVIKDLDYFVEDAVSCDGRGHFLSAYDGEENEETVSGITFYIYRDN